MLYHINFLLAVVYIFITALKEYIHFKSDYNNELQTEVECMDHIFRSGFV